MKSHSHIAFWVTVFLVCILAAPGIVPADRIYQRLVDEVVSVNEVLGPTVGGAVVRSADALHRLVVAAGVDDAIRQGMHNPQERQLAEKYLSVIGTLAVDRMNGYLEGLSMQFYGVLLRGLLVLAWLLLLAPFLIALLLDGISARQVKLAELGYQNPTAFSLAAHVLILLGALPLLYVAAPVALPPSFMFWWCLAIALPASLALSHSQPIFTR